jgi:pyridoxal phosphate enzyme (YggS family)
VTDDAARRAGLVASLAAVRQRIVDAAEACGRDPRSITLVAVTKTYPAADVAALAELGVLDVGESREQEARAKVRELAHRSFSGDLRWHLVGRLQTNKARSVAGFAHAVHSVDRPKLATALAGAASERGAVLDVFVQVSLDDDPERGGAGEQDVAALTDLVASHPSLRLRGVMAVPPIEADPDLAFARLAAISARVRESHPDADAISAGMSHDLESAVRHGSTHVRVGSALLGRRTP